MLLIHGDWDEAREIAEIGVAGEVIMVLWDEMVRVLGVLDRHQWRVDGALEQVARYFPDGPTASPKPTYVPTATALQRLAVSLALDAGDVPLAHEWLVAYDAWLDWSDSVAGQADGTLAWAQYHHARGECALARQHAERALQQATSPRQPLTLIAVHRFLGQLATDDGNVEDAERHLTQSLDLADACRAPFERALTLLAMAGLDDVRGDADAARLKLAEVRATCEALEAQPALERIAALEAHLS
jgi:hypothetical protein